MALLAPLLAFVGRLAGKIVQMAFGWATILLFGRVPQSKSLLLSGVALGSIVWAAALIGLLLDQLVPAVREPLLASVPVSAWASDAWIRVGLLFLAVTLPGAIGIAGLFLIDPGERPRGLGVVRQVLRGYPYALALAMVLVFLTVVAPIRKGRSIVKRWEEAHIPIIVRPGGYDQVANDLEAALEAADLSTERATAPVVLEAPAKLLGIVGGSSVRRMVAGRILVLRSHQLEVTIYPSDVAISGGREQMARARAAIASKLTFTAAYQTTTMEAQEIEDRLERLVTAQHVLPWRALDEIDRRLAHLVVPYDDWQVLYRQRLQVEQLLCRAAHRGGADDGAATGDGPLTFILDLLRSFIHRHRAGAA